MEYLQTFSIWARIFFTNSYVFKNAGSTECELNSHAIRELEKHTGAHAFITIDEMKSKLQLGISAMLCRKKNDAMVLQLEKIL